MTTECSADLFGFAPVEGHEVVASFDGGAITSDAGALLLGAADQAVKMTELWVDIGARNRAEVEARLSVGDPGVIDSKTHDFPSNRIVSRSIDDRIGAFAALEALRRYAARPGSGQSEPAYRRNFPTQISFRHPGMKE